MKKILNLLNKENIKHLFLNHINDIFKLGKKFQNVNEKYIISFLKLANHKIFFRLPDFPTFPQLLGKFPNRKDFPTQKFQTFSLTQELVGKLFK